MYAVLFLPGKEGNGGSLRAYFECSGVDCILFVEAGTFGITQIKLCRKILLHSAFFFQARSGIVDFRAAQGSDEDDGTRVNVD